MASNPKIQPVTIWEFERLLGLPENRDRMLELIDGDVVEKMVAHQHGEIVVFIGAALLAYVRQHKLDARVAAEARFRPADDTQNDRLPDVSLTFGLPLITRGPVMRMPDLAVEVKSPDDSNKLMRSKAAYYLANGSKLVWLIYPDYELVEIYDAGADIRILKATDTLDGGELLPGFSLLVNGIFPQA